MPDPGIDVVAASDASSVIGRTAAVPLVPGSLVPRAGVGPVAWPPDGQAVVAVPVKNTRLADGVAAGSHVLVIEVAKDTATSSGAAAVVPPLPLKATVVSVRSGDDGSGTATVSLLLSDLDAAKVAESAADLSVALARG